MIDSTSNQPETRESSLVEFGVRFAGSKPFTRIFREGMNLVEETAAYLDGKGRRDAKRLDRHASIVYATESMRLTTRLMQLASWLLLQRAVGEGDMTPEEAEREKSRANLGAIDRTVHENPEQVLPDDLKDLIDRSIRLYERVANLDAMLHDQGTNREVPASPLNDQMTRLRAVFGTEADRFPKIDREAGRTAHTRRPPGE